jgi:hypothetical protein
MPSELIELIRRSLAGEAFVPAYVRHISEDTPKPENASHPSRQRDSALSAGVTSGLAGLLVDGAFHVDTAFEPAFHGGMRLSFEELVTCALGEPDPIRDVHREAERADA